MPHSTIPSADTIASFTSEDLETSSIAVAQAVQKHHSTVLNIPSRRESMNTTAHPDFSFVEQPLPTLPTPADVRPDRKYSPPTQHVRPSTAGSEATAVPYRPQQQPSQPSTPSQPPQPSRERAHYFDDHMTYNGHHLTTARERVTRDAPVIAELRTNVIVCRALLPMSTGLTLA